MSNDSKAEQFLKDNNMVNFRSQHFNLDSQVITTGNAREFAKLYHQEQLSHLSSQDVSDEAIEKIVKQLAKESTAPDSDTPNWMMSDIRRGMKAMRSIYQAKLAEKDKEVSDWKWRFDELDRIRTDEANNWKKIAEEKHLRIAELEAQLKQKGGDQ